MRRHLGFGSIGLGAFAALAAIVLPILPSCTADSPIGDYSAPPTGQFDTPDAQVVDAEVGLVEYCPSTECPTGRTTCPESRFSCEVDLRTDSKNCGACGNACPRNTDREIYTCIDGECKMACSVQPPTFDCDGLVENGCEADPGYDDHCTACGDVCSDPAKPCITRDFLTGDIGCGCIDGKTYCPNSFPPCTDPRVDDNNCGECGTACNGVGEGTPHPNMYFGCLNSQCGKEKCSNGYDNCDGKLANGCETSLTTTENCGACGNACSPGQVCGVDQTGEVRCMCTPPLTFCGSCVGGLCFGECYDLSSDQEHCGSCTDNCGAQRGTSHGVCTYGICSRECIEGRADCNGNASDECEIDIDSDPRNCGGCGKACDLVAGQACVGGRCVVEPCKDDAGTETAR